MESPKLALERFAFKPNNQSVAPALTQAEFTKLLQEVHPFFQQQKLNLEIQKKNQKSYLGATDWLLGLNANRSSANLGDSIDLKILNSNL